MNYSKIGHGSTDLKRLRQIAFFADSKRATRSAESKPPGTQRSCGGCGYRLARDCRVVLFACFLKRLRNYGSACGLGRSGVSADMHLKIRRKRTMGAFYPSIISLDNPLRYRLSLRKRTIPLPRISGQENQDVLIRLSQQRQPHRFAFKKPSESTACLRPSNGSK